MERSNIEPINLGVKGSTYPTTRPDGSALRTGDWLTVDGTDDIERYINGKWVLNACVWQETKSLPLTDPSVESVNSTDMTQQDANISFNDSDNWFPIGCTVCTDYSVDTQSKVKAIYGGNSWTNITYTLGKGLYTYSQNGVNTIQAKQGYLCITNFYGSGLSLNNNTNLQIVADMNSSCYPDSNIWVPSSGNNSVGIGEFVQGYQQLHKGAVYMNTFRNITIYNNSGGNLSNQIFEGSAAYKASSISVSYRIWRRTS